MKPIVAFLVLVLVAGVAFSTMPSPGGDNDQKDKMYVMVNISCDGNLVNVSDKNGDPLEGVHISVKDTSDAALIAFGKTDSNGQFVFQDCSRKVDVKATKEDYSTVLTVSVLIDCAECRGCTSNDQCPTDQYCDNNGECVPVPCECGIVAAHACERYECCSDSDCGENRRCIDNSCSGEEPEDGKCDEDSDCLDTEYCNIPAGAAEGRCEEVEGCGSISNHTLVPYACGDAPDCPQCLPGYACVENSCVTEDITCPPTALVGEQKSCNATSGEKPCAGCDYVVTDPSGNETGGKTDENGTFVLPFGMAGGYNVSLLRNGSVVKTIAVMVFPRSGEDGRNTALFSPELMQILLILIVLLLIGAAIFFLKRRKAGEPPKPGP